MSSIIYIVFMETGGNSWKCCNLPAMNKEVKKQHTLPFAIM